MDPAAVRGGWFLLSAALTGFSIGISLTGCAGRPGSEFLTWALTAHPKELLWHLKPL
jgi:hypothetical protein